MVPSSQSKNPEDEDPRVKEMRRLVGEMKSDTSTTLLYDPKEDEKFLKDIRERVNSISTTSPYIEAQKQAEKDAVEAAKIAAAGGAPIPAAPVRGLEGMTAMTAEVAAEMTTQMPAEVAAETPAELAAESMPTMPAELVSVGMESGEDAHSLS